MGSYVCVIGLNRNDVLLPINLGVHGCKVIDCIGTRKGFLVVLYVETGLILLFLVYIFLVLYPLQVHIDCYTQSLKF